MTFANICEFIVTSGHTNARKKAVAKLFAKLAA